MPPKVLAAWGLGCLPIVAVGYDNSGWVGIVIAVGHRLSRLVVGSEYQVDAVVGRHTPQEAYLVRLSASSLLSRLKCPGDILGGSGCGGKGGSGGISVGSIFGTDRNTWLGRSGSSSGHGISA